MILILIIIIGLLILFFIKFYATQTPEYLIKEYEEKAAVFFNSFAVTEKAAYGQEERDEKFNLIESFYNRLKEKYKHESKKLVEIARDWMDYALNLSQNSTGSYLWLEEKDEDASRERNKELQEIAIRIEEIENRFAELLGNKYVEDLDKFRKEEIKKRNESPLGKIFNKLDNIK